MRDPKRINNYCNRLKAMWKRVPDWRFGQLMCNLLGSAGADPFFAEDERMFDEMEKALNRMIYYPNDIVNNHIEGVLRDEQQA